MPVRSCAQGAHSCDVCWICSIQFTVPPIPPYQSALTQDSGQTCMVVHIPPGVERHLVPTSTRPPSKGGDNDRCLRHVGLRCVAQAGLLPGPVGPGLPGSNDSREGVDPLYPRLRSLGQDLVRTPSDLSL